MPRPVKLWVFCTPADRFGGPVLVRDADGKELTVRRGQLGMVDYPLGGGRFESRLAVLGRIVGTRRGLFRVRFADGQTGRFGTLTGWQLEYAPRGAAA